MLLLKRALLTAAGSILISTAASAAPQPVAPKLTPRLRGLLVSEMVSVRTAAHGILDGLVNGDDASVAMLAQRVHDSFIMERSMTPRDRKDLEAALPKEFVAMDQSFHATAGQLAEAARAHERASEHVLFDRMTATCSACHSRFATDVFKGFAPK
ncbi:MAG: cytochrome c [Acidobacteriota bacterium]|nr:cytochrome c [Acidobacteriota bacterium]